MEIDVSHLNITMETVSSRINHGEKDDIWKYGSNKSQHMYTIVLPRVQQGDKVLWPL